MRWLDNLLVSRLVWLIAIVTITVINPGSSSVDEVPNVLHVTASNTSVEEDVQVDPNGYVMFCPCMGRFGNQMSQYIGAIAFAKGLDRTLVLPPFVKYRPMTAGSERVPFSEYFNLSVMQSYHRVIPMEEFMVKLAPTVWPPGRRAGYCYGKDGGCPRMKEGNPFGPFWDHFSINFDTYHNYMLHYETLLDERNARRWHNMFPVAKHPVLAFSGAPGSFPVARHNRHLQKYFKWSENIANLADSFMQEHHLSDSPFVGIHLRLGSDWVAFLVSKYQNEKSSLTMPDYIFQSRACDMLKEPDKGGMKNMMESPQCLDYGGQLNYDICYPSQEAILEQTAAVVEQIEAKAIFVASDSNFMINELKEKCKVNVVRRLPSDAQVDIAILSQSHHFIGNCVSSFTAIVTRDRDVNDKPSSFWNYE